MNEYFLHPPPSAHGDGSHNLRDAKQFVDFVLNLSFDFASYQPTVETEAVPGRSGTSPADAELYIMQIPGGKGPGAVAVSN